MLTRRFFIEFGNFIVVLLLPVIAYLPISLRLFISRFICKALLVFSSYRVSIVSSNLKACFPDMSLEEMLALKQRCFENISYGFTENAVSWHRSDSYIKKSLTRSNFAIVENYNNAGLPVIFLLPHFTHMFLAIRSIRILTPGYGIRKEQNSKICEAYYNRCFKKNKMNDILQHETKKAIFLLRKKHNFVLLPDADLGMKNSVFADFFGIKAATVTSVSKLARLGGAKVVAVNFYRENNKYMLQFEDLSDHMTFTELESDAALINKTFEKYIKMHPDQYGWLHRRFKTRPLGEEGIY